MFVLFFAFTIAVVNLPHHSIFSNLKTHAQTIQKEKIVNIISLSNEKIEILSLAVKHKLSYFDAEYLYLSNKLKFDLITYYQQLQWVANKRR